MDKLKSAFARKDPDNEEDELDDDEKMEREQLKRAAEREVKEKLRIEKEKEREIKSKEREEERARKEALKPKARKRHILWSIDKSVAKIKEWPETRQGYLDLGFYLGFVVLYIVIVTMQMNIGSQYTLGAGLQSQFNYVTSDGPRSLSQIATQSDFWTFMLSDTGLLSRVFPDTWYNGKTYSSAESGYFLEYDKVVGGLLLVQTRGLITDDGCEGMNGPTSYKQFYSGCYTMDADTTNQTVLDDDVGSAFNYSDSLGGYSFFFSLAAGREKNMGYAKKLKVYRWTDKQTRSVEIKLALYNGNLNAFAFVTISFDYGINGIFTGGNHISYQTIIMEPYRTSSDTTRFILEIIFMILVSNQICNFLHETYNEMNKPNVGYKALTNVWTIVDAANLTLLGIFVALRVLVLWMMTENIIVVPTNKYEPILEQISSIQNVQKVGNFMNLFLSLFRLFRFYQFQERLNVLNRTFGEAVVDLYHFVIMFAVIFGCFGIMAHFLFGLSLRDYNSVGHSLQTLWQMALGQFDYNSMEKTNANMAAVFFISFMFLVQMVLLNLLLAILIDAYTQANNPGAESVFAELGMGVMKLYLQIRRSGIDDQKMLKALVKLQRRQYEMATTEDIIKALPTPARLPQYTRKWPDLREFENVNPQDEFEAKVGTRVKKENLIDQLDAVLQENSFMHRRVSLDPDVKLPTFKSVPKKK